jgi:hypothetical protein
MKTKIMKEVDAVFCDYCNEEILDSHYAVHVEEFLKKEKHFRDMPNKPCYKKYKGGER